jgi:hypothetical protein
MNNHFYQFAHSAEIYTAFVNDYRCGWFDGGCFIFARALQLWLGGRLAVIVRDELLGEQTFDHVVLSLPNPLRLTETLYVDADGATTAAAILACWRIRERLPTVVLEDPADHGRFVSPLRKESWSAWLAAQFETNFGKPHWSELAALLGRME